MVHQYEEQINLIFAHFKIFAIIMLFAIFIHRIIIINILFLNHMA